MRRLDGHLGENDLRLLHPGGRAVRTLEESSLLLDKGARNCLLEHIQSVVVVEHADRITDSGDLLGAEFLALCPLLLLDAALLFERFSKSLGVSNLLRGVFD